MERVAAHHYAVVRLLDDVGVGSFRTVPGLRLEPRGCDDDLFAEIAKTALRFARTSGVMAAVVPPLAKPDSAPQHLAPLRSPPSSLPPDPALV